VGILVDRSTPPVAVKFGNEPDDGLEVNTVLVKAKLTLGDTIHIEEASYKMEMAGDGSTAFRVPVSSIGQMVATLRTVVAGWSGPLFEGVKYKRTIWEEIDTAECEWWIRLVHQRVNALNKPRSDDPKAADPNG
jgi:hypothetical protein